MPPARRPAAVEVLAMHGWAGQGSSWQPWQRATAGLGWHWHCGERGYGAEAPRQPCWSGEGVRLLIGHSLGPHLVAAEQLAAAEVVVLLASFGRFVPAGRAGRALRTALAGMAAQLEEFPEAAGEAPVQTEASRALRAQAMLHTFLSRAAAPQSSQELPPLPGDQPVAPQARQRLRADLQLLEATSGLPPGFPQRVPVLIVEAGADRIVDPASRQLLREALPQAECLTLEGVGHALLTAELIPLVLEWLQRRLAP
ncbi:MAG: alpha/beta hydrolase [Cyanobacteriota bacterium]